MQHTLVLKQDALDTVFDGMSLQTHEGGPAAMIDGSIYKQLESEHCGSPDSTIPLATPQTKSVALVLPKSQWAYVVDGRQDTSRSP